MNPEIPKSAAVFELAKILGQQNDFQEIVRLISSTATALFNAEVASIMMINPSTQETIKTIFKGGKEIAAAPYQYVQNVVVGWAMKHQRAFVSADLQADARFDQEAFAGEAVRAAMCVPFMSQGRALGYMLVLSENAAAAFNEAALHLLENLAAVCTPFLSNVQRIQEYFNAPLPEVALLGQFEPLGLIGKSKPFIELLRAVEAASRCDVRVLLEGQSGTGKERVARAIHELSGRKKSPFVAIDCGAIPEHLIESELFGHARGAFTGANYERKGLIVEAHQGTLFMDEMANLPVEMQAKLLRVLQEGEVRPVGSNKSREVDVRIIAAASVSLR
jgi:transcriptional regulator with GAF, ATPase, and Fis domain